MYLQKGLNPYDKAIGGLENLEIIKKNNHYRKIYGQGVSVADRFLVLYACFNGYNVPKFGFSISKKVGKAVERNRLRRLLKEVCRLNPQLFPEGYDYVFIVRREGAGLSFQQVTSSIHHLSARIKKKINF